MSNSFSPYVHGNNPPAFGSYAIAPSDSADLSKAIRAVTIGTAGVLAWVSAVDGQDYITAELPPGTYALSARRIRATGTTAAKITGWI